LPDQPGGDAEDLVTLARKAHDLDAVRKSVEDAASVEFFQRYRSEAGVHPVTLARY
jgi:hypothetical protein